MSAVESWFAPAAAVAAPLPRKGSARRASAALPATLPARQRSRRRTPARPKAQPQRSFRVRLPLIWMVVFALLLVGVVAVNVAVLRASVSVNDLDKTITQLQEGNANLASQYSSATAAPRVEAAALRDHLVPAPSLTPIDMGGRK